MGNTSLNNNYEPYDRDYFKTNNKKYHKILTDIITHKRNSRIDELNDTILTNNVNKSLDIIQSKSGITNNNYIENEYIEKIKDVNMNKVYENIFNNSSF